VPGGGALVPDVVAAAFDVSGAAAVVAAGLDPSPAAAARLAARIPALAPLPSGGLPDGLPLSPAFTDPVSRDVSGPPHPEEARRTIWRCWGMAPTGHRVRRAAEVLRVEGDLARPDDHRSSGITFREPIR
jgi:hypothetical protein